MRGAVKKACEQLDQIDTNGIGQYVADTMNTGLKGAAAFVYISIVLVLVVDVVFVAI